LGKVRLAVSSTRIEFPPVFVAAGLEVDVFWAGTSVFVDVGLCVAVDVGLCVVVDVGMAVEDGAIVATVAVAVGNAFWTFVPKLHARETNMKSKIRSRNDRFINTLN
jgi:hypothetical protein